MINVVGKGNYFNNYSDQLADAFSALGHEVNRFDEDTYEIPDIKADLHVIVSPNCYNRDTVKALNGIKVGILTEQMPHIGWHPSHYVLDRVDQFMRHMNHYDFYVEWSEANYQWFKQNFPGLRFMWFPHGAIQNLQPDSTPSQNPQYDLCFLGSLNPRRTQILNKLKEAGIYMYPEHENVWGEDKRLAYWQSKAVLNLHYTDSPPSFEAHRLFEAASYNKINISEPINDAFAEEWVVQCDQDNFVDFVKDALASEHVIENGVLARRYLEQEVPLTNLAKFILEAVNG